jgi:FkbM family methyltransferase
MCKKQIIYIILILSFLFFFGLLNFQCNQETDSEGRYIFIDGGAHFGETIISFMKSRLYSEHQWKIYSFECNPQLVERLYEHFSQVEGLEIKNEALWIHNNGVTFYFGKSSLGGNIVKNKYTAKKRERIHVESIDFGEWLKENFKIEDTIYVKLDIEGAEYKILNKMLRDGSIRYVDKFYLEFHSFIMKNITEEKDKKLIKRITKLGIPIQLKSPGKDEGDYFSQ